MDVTLQTHTQSLAVPVFCPEILALPGRPPLRGSLPTGWCQATASGPEPTDTRCSGAVNGAPLKFRFSVLSVPPPLKGSLSPSKGSLLFGKIHLRSQQDQERSLHSRGSIGARPPTPKCRVSGVPLLYPEGGSASSSQCHYRPKVENTSICFGG